DGVSGDGSEILRDPHAATVLENAASELAATGELETGLVLLPFNSHWSEGGKYQYLAGVQIFTFSSSTITRRGIMVDGDIRRSFPASSGGIVANLANFELSLFDRSRLSGPAELGRLELAPIYLEILSYGDYRVRLKDLRAPYVSGKPQPPYEVQVISSDEPADSAEPVARFEVPEGTSIFKASDSLLVTVLHTSDNSAPPFRIQTTITTYDLSDPRAPRQLGQVVTSKLPSTAWTWRQGDRRQPTFHVVGDSLVFLSPIDRVSEGDFGLVCKTEIWDNIPCAGEAGCTYPAGAQTCYDFGPGTQFCEGGFAQCTYHGDGQSTCEPRQPDELGVELQTYCEDAMQTRRWTQLDIHLVDVSNPAAPALVQPITLPAGHEALSVLVQGSALHVNTKVPVTVAGDPRPHARHFTTRIDLSTPAQPVVGAPVNVPGEPFAVQGNKLLTRDKVWGAHFAETAVARVVLASDNVLLQRYHRFFDRSVSGVVAGDDGLIAVKHSQAWGRDWGNGPFSDALTLMRSSSSGGGQSQGALGFDVLSQSALSAEPRLQGIAADRLFLTYAGMQVIDVSNPVAPVARAIYSVAPVELDEAIIEDGVLLVPAQARGIEEIDLDAENLASAP
ncbi:MAG TPA: hypothetical protein VNM90_21035, partial [Haliangium sp.]|nr:hypothetical protein [Haliangium sp.]